MVEDQDKVLLVLVVDVTVAAGISRPWWSVSSVAQKDRSGVMACCGAAILSRMLGGWALDR